jgi:ABC-type polysaccharide/polyol phosphate transport system ATPase subunit
LKLICSIITPNAGRIQINGRVSSLLELGTGFHPDLSGQENIYLNGSILGLSPQEIARKYESIVEFSELADYIHLPVKHYSSGMYLRLAFSVASHVDPDILLIDEAIAVGDYIFQQRCLKRLAKLRQSGVTMILISHGLDLIQNNCDRGIWLENGQIQQDSHIDQVVEQYIAAQYQRQARKQAGLPPRVSLTEWQNRLSAGQEIDRWGTGEIEIGHVEFLDQHERPLSSFRVGQPFITRIHYDSVQSVEAPVVGVGIYRADGLHINGPNTKQAGLTLPTVKGEGYIDYMIEALNLLPGEYEMSVAIYDSEAIQAYDHQHRLHHFQVLPGEVTESHGAFYLPSRWRYMTGETREDQGQLVNSGKTMLRDW